MASIEKHNELMDMLTREEELHPDLQPYLTKDDVCGWMLRHPLVYEVFYRPGHAGQANARFEQSKKMIARRVAVRDWGGALAFFERPYRIDALWTYADMMEPREYWQQLAWVWRDSENLAQKPLRFLEKLFNRHPPPRDGLMTQDELTGLSELPERVTIYRGHCRRHRGDLSWTLSRDMAVWFATRFRKESANTTLLTGEVSRRHIWAYFDSRNEDEIVVPSRAVTILKRENV